MLIRKRLVAPLLVGTLLAGGGTAYLASNTQPVSGEGVSNTLVNGYIISNIHYTVADPGGPQGPPPPGGGSLQVNAVSFTATSQGGNGLATQAFARLDPPPAPQPWSTCTVSGYPANGISVNFTCPFTPGVHVNGGPGPGGMGWIDSLELEVNQ